MKYYSNRKGIIIAGGNGKRLTPITRAISKQIIPIYDKPMIYYPLTTLMLCGVKNILIITTPSSHDLFKKLLGNGKQWGLNFNYEVQKSPRGVADAILCGEDFIDNSPVVIVLGDNIFHGDQLVSLLHSADQNYNNSTIFAYPVSNPEKYGVVQFDKHNCILSIEEKPEHPKSQYVVPGLYFYDQSMIERIKELEVSSRNELEITSLNQSYLNDQILNIEVMGRGMAWLDAGTFDSLHEGSAFIRSLEHRQGLKVGCPEEVAWRQGWISNKQLHKLASSLVSSEYGKYLIRLLE